MRKLSEFIEIGRITNTHGIRGEMKVEFWCDSPDDFMSLKSLYLQSGEELKISCCRPANKFAVVLFCGVSSPEAGARLKGRTVYAKREDIPLDNGSYFLSDLVGLPVYNVESGEKLGVVSDILEKPASFVYTVKTQNGEFMIPAVDEFIKKVDINEGVYIKVIPGLIE